MSVFLILIHYIHFELECFSIGIAYSGYIVPFTIPHISIFEAREPDGTERNGVCLSEAH